MQTEQKEIIPLGVNLGDGGREGLCKGKLPVLGRGDDGELGGAVVRHLDVCHHCTVQCCAVLTHHRPPEYRSDSPRAALIKRGLNTNKTQLQQYSGHGGPNVGKLQMLDKSVQQLGPRPLHQIRLAAG